jgi:hypothetical protein
MTSTKEALSLYEQHREEMLKKGRDTAMSIYLAGGREPITAQDVFAAMRDAGQLDDDELACNGRWIAAVFCHKGTPWVKVGLRTVSDSERNCNGTLRAEWRLAADEGIFPSDLFFEEESI